MTAAGGDPGTGADRFGRRVAVALVVSLVAVVAAALVFAPRGTPTRAVSALTAPDGAAAIATFSVDSVDAGLGQFVGRLVVEPGPALPPGGARLLTEVGSVPDTTVTADRFTPEVPFRLDADAGDVESYPFDDYRSRFAMVLVPLDAEPAAGGPAAPLPLEVRSVAAAPGFRVDGSAEVADGVVVVDVEAARNANVVAWALAMMGINWLLALSVLGVTVLVAAGRRDWESRHLAWLGAMVFALAAFRNTAPGQPPIGTFLDFGAFFPAVAVVALCLVALVGTFLLRPRDALGL